jgi:two-component system, OmpR family, response regulator
MGEALAERVQLGSAVGVQREATARWAVLSAELDDALGHLALVELTERALLGGPVIMIVGVPAGAARLDELRQLCIPRLIVVGPDDDAVSTTEELEDWVRLPADDRDVRSRLRRLRELARHLSPPPVMDGAGRVILGDHWIALSEVEERLAFPLVGRFGNVVRLDDLMAAGWPGRRDRAILRPAMCRLRRRVETLGLELLSIRDVGYVLQPRTTSTS